ncbi:MAG: hypothetical protein ABFE07_06975 [Armatimonadia bacterium]
MSPTWQREGTTYVLDVVGRGRATIMPKGGEFVLLVARDGGRTDYVFGRSVVQLQAQAEEKLGRSG